MPPAGDIPFVTTRNITAALKNAGGRGVFIGFSAGSCNYCTVHEAEWSSYLVHSNALPATVRLPQMVWVDGDRERSLLRRHEVQEIPALVLAWHDRWTPYSGLHTRAAMAAFGSAHLSPAAIELDSEAALQRLITEQQLVLPRSDVDDLAISPILLLGFFNDLDDEADEVDDFVHAASDLRKVRTDTAVRAAYIRVSRGILAKYTKERRWFEAAPSAVVLLGGVPSHGGSGSGGGGSYRLSERDEDNLSLGMWAARAALPEVGELSGATFAAYAATSLPMLMAFVKPPAAQVAAPLLAVLRAVAARYRSKLCVVTCDGVGHAPKMLSLGLQPDAPLPQLAINTKDGRQLPFPTRKEVSEKQLALFVAAFLGERLPPPLPATPPPSSPPTAGRDPTKINEGWSSDEGRLGGTITELTAASFESVALDVTKDVLLLLHAPASVCDSCATFAPFFQKVADRVAQLGLSARLSLAQLDVQLVSPLPKTLQAVPLHSLPTVLMLPASRKEPPLPLFDGNARPKELLYFAKRHASHAFELPPNPHLTREQHAAWKQQVGNLPSDKVERAYKTLHDETGLDKDEV